MRMGVPPATSAGAQMWVRGPTAQQAAQAPATQQAVQAPAAQQAAQAPAAPVARAAPAAPLAQAVQAAPSRPAQKTAPSWPPTPAERASAGHRGQRVAWVSTHGGAGASTLARVLGGADVGRRWPDPARGEPGRVLLVARTHNAGTRAVSQALNALRKGEHPAGVHLLAVVLVADAPGRLPRPLGRRVRVLRSAAKVHRVPWVPAWRLGEEIDQLPRAVRALARAVSAPAGQSGRSR